MNDYFLDNLNFVTASMSRLNHGTILILHHNLNEDSLNISTTGFRHVESTLECLIGAPPC